MKSLLPLLLLILKGIIVWGSTEQCLMEKCFDKIPTSSIEDLGPTPPNEVELKALCPPILELYKCIQDKHSECTGQDLLTSAIFGNSSVSPFAKLAVNVGLIVTDLCSNSTALHQAYVKGITCFRNIVQSSTSRCNQKGNRTYTDFEVSGGTVSEGNDTTAIVQKRQCWVTAYTAACISAVARERCSVKASLTFLEILKKSTLLDYNSCKPKDTEAVTKWFLQSMDIEEKGALSDALIYLT